MSKNNFTFVMGFVELCTYMIPNLHDPKLSSYPVSITFKRGSESEEGSR